MDNVEKTPLGWLINLLFLCAHCCTVLAEDIDMQLRNKTNGVEFFNKDKKKALYNY